MLQVYIRADWQPAVSGVSHIILVCVGVKRLQHDEDDDVNHNHNNNKNKSFLCCCVV